MNPKRHRYITTAIDYANGAPHLGHALEKIGGDVMARYRRLKGEKVHYVIGMDEHGQKVLQSAQERGISPQEWVDELAELFAGSWKRLLLSHDDFLRTTETRHHRAAQELVRRIRAADDLYTDRYAGYYCVGCEAYKTEDELEPRPGASAHVSVSGRQGGAQEAESDAESESAASATSGAAPGAAAGAASIGQPGAARAEGLQCPLHAGRTLEWMEEENWFFRLSKYQDRLLDLLDERPEFVLPESRRNEVRKVIEGGLEDISVSRGRLPWGVPWPDDPEHVIYVWLEALSSYLSSTGFPDDGYQEYWPADFHVIGKDITRFHCIYWPAFLMSAELALPRTVWAHGFINFGGGKMSKSAGVTARLDEAIDRHGPDALRYYLMREIPWNGDGDFAWDRFDDIYTAELANDLGNLASRSLSMIERYRDGVIPSGEQTELDAQIPDTLVRYRAAMDRNLLHQGIAAAMELAGAANSFIEERAPWALAKDPGAASALDATLGALARALVALSTMLEPFMPAKMARLAADVGLDSVPRLDDVVNPDLAGKPARRGEVLFPRADR